MSAAGPGGATRVGAVLGWPVEHSASPRIHNAAFAAAGLDAVFVAFPVRPAELGEAVRGLRALGALGASVTVPHKEAVVPLCDRLDESAREVGAVNCLVFSAEREIVGHNTDAGGFADAFERGVGREVAGLRAVLLGAGGACRAVRAGLLARGAGTVTVIARRPEKVRFAKARPFTAEALEAALDDCDLLVDCTPTGLSAETEDTLPAPIPLEALPDGAAVATLVYHREPALLADARARGLATLDGAGMLVHQGARAFSLWTGKEAPVEAMWQALTGRRPSESSR